jgi:hypothetical protein
VVKKAVDANTSQTVVIAANSLKSTLAVIAGTSILSRLQEPLKKSTIICLEQPRLGATGGEVWIDIELQILLHVLIENSDADAIPFLRRTQAANSSRDLRRASTRTRVPRTRGGASILCFGPGISNHVTEVKLDNLYAMNRSVD